MHSAFIFLFLLQLVSNQVTGRPSHGPFQGPFPIPPIGPGFSVGQGVRTTSGLILGQPAPSRPEVSEYLGIPFAKPPVGDLRFAAPQALFGIGNLNATAFVSVRNLLSKTQTNGPFFAVRVSTLN